MIDLSAIPGNGWPASKLKKARAFLQNMLDTRILAADIPLDEETLGWTDAEMQAVYNGRMWYDNGDLVSRATVVTEVLWDGSRLNISLRSA